MRTILDRCLAAGNGIAVHENGFLTIALPYGLDGRLHLWGQTLAWDRWLETPGHIILREHLIPCQRVSTPVHDHTFGMTSQILGGEVYDNRWVVAKLAGNGDQVWGPYSPHSPDGDGKLQPRDHLGATSVYLKRAHRNLHQAGDMYNVPVGALHQTETYGPAATLMLRTRYASFKDMRPYVMVPEGLEPDNEFRRDAFDHNLLVLLARRILREVLP